MKRSLGLAILALLFFPLALKAARLAGPVIVVDFSHGENTRGLCEFLGTVPEAYWVIVVPNKNFQLPQCTVKPYKVVVGNFASKDVQEVLREADAVVIGQPTQYLTKAELNALSKWFKSSPGKVLWCAGDSDYPAQGGNMEIAQHACDAVFKAVGSKLRIDFVSVEDTKSNAGAAYRVVGIVKPDARYNAQIIAYGAKKVLFHGPGAVAWVDSKGKWHKLTDPGTPQNLIKIVLTTKNGRIVEHQPVRPGAPGEFGRAHHVGETGTFVLMAAEVIGKKAPYSVVIASGESPYGGYQPMVTFRYHNIPLDGPRFVRNVFLWSLSYPAELGALSQVYGVMQHNMKVVVMSEQALAQQVQSQLNTLQRMTIASVGLALLALALTAAMALNLI